MSGYVGMQHDPPHVLTVVVITCRTCEGDTSYRNEADGLCHCHHCQNGYEAVLVDALELHRLVAGNLDPHALHRAVVELAEGAAGRLPFLTRGTAGLPTYLRPRVPLVAANNVAPV